MRILASGGWHGVLASSMTLGGDTDRRCRRICGVRVDIVRREVFKIRRSVGTGLALHVLGGNVKASALTKT